jgi:N-acetyl-beta-hexosaminidase
MASVLGGIIDTYRGKANGKRRYVGKVLLFDGRRKPVKSVMAEVYGDTMEEMRRRKHAVAAALKALEETELSKEAT